MTTTQTPSGGLGANAHTVPAAQHHSAGAPTGQRPVAPLGEDLGPRLSFGGVVRSEWLKLSSLRSIRITLLLTVLGGIGLSLLIAWAATGDGLRDMPAEAMPSYLLTVATFPATFVSLIFGVLGVFAVSSEYSSGMILSSLTAVPRRTPVYLAKTLVLTLISGISALVIIAGGIGIAVAFVPGAAAHVFEQQVVSGALGTVAYLVLISLFAFGVAALLRSTAGGIAIVACLVFVLPIGMQVLSLTSWEWVPVAAELLPSMLGSTLSQGIGDASMIGGPVTIEGEGVSGFVPDFWGALGFMAAWAAVAVIPALVAFKRRDAK